jgi:hypothetical protein
VSALQSIFPIGRAAGVEAPAVAIFSFVPAGGSVRRRNHCRKVVRKLSEAMGVCLTAEGDGRAVLLADFSGTGMASEAFVTCLDLADASEPEAREALRMSEAAFVVATSDAASIEDACAQTAWMLPTLRAQGQGAACGLLLVPVLGGLPPAEAEKRIGLPLCGVLKTANQVARVARRMALD